MMRAIVEYRAWIFGGILLLLGSCAFSVAPTRSEDTSLTLELSAFPDKIAVGDTVSVAEIWATVRQGGRPVKDSTVVAFASTVGEITPFSFSIDGLAVATLTISGPGEDLPPEGLVVAQAMTVRDSLFVDIVVRE